MKIAVKLLVRCRTIVLFLSELGCVNTTHDYVMSGVPTVSEDVSSKSEL